MSSLSPNCHTNTNMRGPCPDRDRTTAARAPLGGIPIGYRAKEQDLEKAPHALSAAAILGGALLIASVTGAARSTVTSAVAARPPVTSAGPGWLAGPGGHALEKVGRDIAVLPARPERGLGPEAVG